MKKKLKTISKYIPLVFTFGVRIFWNYFTWINRYFRHKDKIPYEKRRSKFIKLLDNGIKDLKVEVIVEGKENIPESGCYFVSNHLSAFDGIIYFSLLKDHEFKIVAKEEIKKYPFVGKGLACVDTVFLPREDLKQSLRLMMDIQKELTLGKSYLIFAEGTRNRDSLANVLPMHPGTFRPAVKANVPIVPIAMTGIQRMLHLSQKYKKYPVHVKILKPIYPDEYSSMTTDEIATKVRNDINNTLTYDLLVKDAKQMSKIAKNYNHSLCGRTI